MPNMVTACVIAFVSAAVTDMVLVKYIKAVALDQAGRAAILSMIMAMCLLTGVTQALQSGPASWFWVLGYGVGSYMAVKWQTYVKVKTA